MIKQQYSMADFNNLKVGDILVCCWGCTMMLFDFFQVVGKTTSCVKIRELAKNNTPSNGFLRYDVTPIKDRFTSDVLLRRPSKNGYIKGAYESQLMRLTDFYNENETYTEDHAD